GALSRAVAHGLGGRKTPVTDTRRPVARDAGAADRSRRHDRNRVLRHRRPVDLPAGRGAAWRDAARGAQPGTDPKHAGPELSLGYSRAKDVARKRPAPRSRTGRASLGSRLSRRSPKPSAAVQGGSPGP